jgi:hypothetical protein
MLKLLLAATLMGAATTASAAARAAAASEDADSMQNGWFVVDQAVSDTDEVSALSLFLAATHGHRQSSAEHPVSH